MTLTNDGQLELIWLGAGGAFSKMHNNTNLLVIKGNDHILIDFGITGPRALTELEIEPTDILNVLPTHQHSDHVGGIEWLAQQNYWIGRPYKNKTKINLYGNPTHLMNLWKRTLSGGLEIIQTEDGLNSKYVDMDEYFNIVAGTHFDLVSNILSREMIDYKIGDLKIQTFSTNHIPGGISKSIGVFIDDRVFYSGDTRFDIDLINYYSPISELMFHEVSEIECPVHTHFKDLEKLPKEILDKLFCVHYDSIPSSKLRKVYDGSRYII